MLTLDITLYWMLLGIIGGLLLRYKIHNIRLLFLLGTLGSFFLLIMCCFTLKQPTLLITVTLGIPGYPLHFSWDVLSAFFVLLLSAASIGIGLFSSHYFRNVDSRTQSLLFFNYHWFLASMIWVFLAADAFAFLMAWEFMALSSYFLIVAFKSTPENSRAGFLYLFIAHLSGGAILLSFAIMSPVSTDFTFEAMRHWSLSPTQANLAFLWALVGFGAKAGLLPLHVWLPEAHPAAPSPISALMSGVMLKTAIYGMIRIFFDVLSTQHFTINCGLIVLTAGILTALLGIILAAMQTDMKRLLAYSSIENLGIIVLAIGLALLLHTANLNLLATLALVAGLFHCFNHAFFKSLLFLCTGSVLHATGERNLGKLGGLIAPMPWVAGFALIGTLAMSGIPPLNGFFSEWLLLQAFLFSSNIQAPFYLTLLLPVAAAAFALSIGVAAFVLVKFYGIIFLGKQREAKLAQASDAAFFERLGLGWFASGCVLIGLFPYPLLQYLNQLTTVVLRQPSVSLSTHNSWLFLTPINASKASYSPLLLFCVITFVTGLLYAMIRWFYHGQLRRSAAWDCGYPLQTARMQDTAEGFGQPIKHIFSQFLYIRRIIPTAFDKNPIYANQTDDRFWYMVYSPSLRIIFAIAKLFSKIQQGKISYYLMYSFITLLLLLWWAL